MSEYGGHDDFTPPEGVALAHIENKELVRILSNLTGELHENTRQLEILRNEIAKDPRPLGAYGGGRIADKLDGAAKKFTVAAESIRGLK